MKSKQKRRKNEGGEEWNGGGSNKGEGGKKETSPTVMVDYYNQFSHIFISVHHGRSRASKKIIILSLTHSLSLSFPSLPPLLALLHRSFFFFFSFPQSRNHPTRSGGTLGANDKPKREAILDLSKYVNEPIRIKLMGGRQVEGTLKGYDQLLNLVLDNVEEYIHGKSFFKVQQNMHTHTCSHIHIHTRTHATEPEPHTRSLGLVVVRGPLITIVSPMDGSEEIANPFTVQE